MYSDGAAHHKPSKSSIFANSTLKINIFKFYFQIKTYNVVKC